jgi:hypothetical protein
MMKFAFPEELKEEMNKFPEINWSEVVQASIKEKLAALKFLKTFTSDSEITSEDAEKFGREVSELVARHYEGK